MKIVENGVKQVKIDVDNAVLPLLNWNDENCIDVYEKIKFLEKSKTETVEFGERVQKFKQ